MTDDSTEPHIITQKLFALATAEMPGGGEGVPQIVDNIPNVDKHTVLTYPDIVTCHTRTFARLSPMGLDMTAGNFVMLPLVFGRSSTGPTFIDHILSLPIDTFLGLRDTEAGDFDSPPEYSSNKVAQYAWIKFKKLTVSLKNFMFTVERDATGGIQALDEPIFEIRKSFSTEPNSVDELAFGGQRFTLADMQKGIHINIPFTQIGWYASGQLWSETAGVVTYRTLDQMLNFPTNLSTLPGQEPTQVLFCHDTPNFFIEMRQLNFPALTNIRLNMNYTWEASAIVDVMICDQINVFYLANPGPTGAIIEKRKIEQKQKENKKIKIV